MGKKDKQKAPPKAAPGPAPATDAPEIPLSTAPLQLLLLEPALLGEFFELCFADRRLLELCEELRLYSPGYRIENMPPNQVARMLADEVRAAKDAQALVEKAVREALRNPVMEGIALPPDGYRDLLELFTGDALQHVARVAWRGLLEEKAPNAEAQLAVEFGVDLLDVMAQKPKSQPRKPPPPGAREAEEAVKRADRAEKEAAALREQLAAARAGIAERETTLAAERAELRKASAELSRVSAELARLNAAGEGSRALVEARRSADEARSLSEKLKVALAELDALQARLDATEKKLERPAAPLPAAPVDELPSEEDVASFLIPLFTREFYDSIDRWSRRMQRAAFDKIHLLAHDWRHGSLRAIALEGLPGYYRIRVATDVRLIYRRDGPKLEILSLIDREDLDRYIRQARTRSA
jgi:hypothetical protein